jgi:hypothetical protein
MTLKDRIQDLFTKYSVALEVEEKPEETPAEMQMKKLDNGTEVYTEEEFSEGASVFVMNEEGEKIPLPDGEYTMEDGGTLEVEDGKVAMMGGDKKEEEEEMSEETPFATVEQVADMITKALGIVQEDFAAQLASKDKEVEQAKEELAATKKEAAAAPVARAAQEKFTQPSKPIGQMTAQERVAFISNQFTR